MVHTGLPGRRAPTLCLALFLCGVSCSALVVTVGCGRNQRAGGSSGRGPASGLVGAPLVPAGSDTWDLSSRWWWWGGRSQYFTEGAWREQLMGTLCGQREDQPGHLANMKITKMSRQAVTRPRSHPRLLSLPFPEGLRGAGAPTPVPAILGVVGGQRWCGVACCPPGAQSTPSLKTGWFFKSCSEVAVPVEGGRGATAGSAFCI